MINTGSFVKGKGDAREVGSIWRAQEFSLLSLNHWSETWLLGWLERCVLWTAAPRQRR